MSKPNQYQQFKKLTCNQWHLLAFLTLLERYREVPSQPMAEIILEVGNLVNYPKLQKVNLRLKKWTSPWNLQRLKKWRLLRLYAWARIPKLQIINWWYRRYLAKLEIEVTIEIRRDLVNWLVSLSGLLLEDAALLTPYEKKDFFKALNEANSNQLIIM